jgi:hypothetical protein
MNTYCKEILAWRIAIHYQFCKIVKYPEVQIKNLLQS